ncbi:hypothetical protein N4P33_31740 [Streptomyces sp. 15-116A]|uniref:tetratricopeptide repeat protein n=1 Tax=Streptomyces sp. 15-116A TaxID=2259035 RepID=UPI0021B3C7A5|nr:hypothetical protein [Streptomyces sp. 15-116A]MCT7356684.1 hypothetical protein [Streptomyces sp. 15-116A]
MTQPPPPAYDPPAPTAYDPVAVALGNASLPGVGYLLLGRRAWFWTAAVITVALAWTTIAVAETWCEVLLLLWWAAVVTHGRLLARRRAAGPRWGQRLLALALAAAVFPAAVLLRLDAHGIAEDVTEAREGGDCEAVTAAQEKVWWGHRLAAAPVATRGDTAVEACARVGRAEEELTAGLTGDLDAVEWGYQRLASVLKEPGNEATVRAAMDRFLEALPTEDACETVAITDWLRERKAGRNVLDRSAATATRLAPAALLKCGDTLRGESAWPQARTHYEQLLKEYPGDNRAGQARKGIRQVVLAEELSQVEGLVRATNGMSSGYCADPARYSGAPARRKGGNPTLFLGDDTYTGRLPAGWRTTDARKAALVVCAGEADFGSAVQTCPYRADDTGSITNVTFRKIKVPVRVFELRTGKLLSKRTVQIGGSSCPGAFFTYGGVPSNKYVTPSGSDIRDAFSSVVRR